MSVDTSSVLQTSPPPLPPLIVPNQYIHVYPLNILSVKHHVCQVDLGSTVVITSNHACERDPWFKVVSNLVIDQSQGLLRKPR